MNNKKLLAMALMIMGSANAMEDTAQTNAHVVKKSEESKEDYESLGYSVEHLPDGGECEQIKVDAWLKGIIQYLNKYDCGEEKLSKEQGKKIAKALQCTKGRVQHQPWMKNQLTLTSHYSQSIEASLLRLKKDSLLRLKKNNKKSNIIKEYFVQQINADIQKIKALITSLRYTKDYEKKNLFRAFLEDIVQGSDSKGEGNNPDIREINANIQKIEELIARLRKVKKDKKIKQELRDEAVTRMKKTYSMIYNNIYACSKCTYNYNYPSSDNNSIVDRLSSGLEDIKKKIGR